MPWATFILFVVSGYVAFSSIVLSKKSGSLKLVGLSFAVSIFFLMQLSSLLEFYISNSTLSIGTQIIADWGPIVGLAAVLSSMAVFIRDSKPNFAKFPLSYTAFPLLIILSYALVRNTLVLKEWLIGIYQGGSIIIAALMYGVYAARDKSYLFIVGGIILFLLTFIFYWFIPGMENSFSWVWKILFAAGLLLSLYGYEQINPEN